MQCPVLDTNYVELIQVIILAGQNTRQAGREEGRQIGRKAGRYAGRQTVRQEERQAVTILLSWLDLSEISELCPTY